MAEIRTLTLLPRETGRGAKPVDGLAAMLAWEDAAEERDGLSPHDRITCPVHRRWVHQCVSSPAHAIRVTGHRWCRACEHRCRSAGPAPTRVHPVAEASRMNPTTTMTPISTRDLHRLIEHALRDLKRARFANDRSGIERSERRMNAMLDQLAKRLRTTPGFS